MAKSVYQFKYNNFTFGAGTPYAIIDIDGLASQPDLRVQDTPRGYNDGFLTGRDFFNGRTITFTLHIFAGNGHTAWENWLTLQTAMQPVQQLTGDLFIVPPTGNGVLQFNLSSTVSYNDFSYVMSARVRTRKAKIDPEYTYGMIKAQVEMFAPDYRYYSTSEMVAVAYAAKAYGRIYNRTYNLVYNQARPTESTATISLDNSTGTAAAGFQISIIGAITNPQITNLATGAYIALNATLSSADTIVINTADNTITLNGSNARNLMTGGSQFFTIPAGSAQNLYFTSLTGSDAQNGIATARWLQAYT